MDGTFNFLIYYLMNWELYKVKSDYMIFQSIFENIKQKQRGSFKGRNKMKTKQFLLETCESLLLL